MSNDVVITWDLETVPDLAAASRMLGMTGKPPTEVREALGPEFPKLPLHAIACIGALVAHREAAGWQVDALGAPHIGEHTEAEIIRRFVTRIAELEPRLVTFNGNSFDLPVLRYRAMVNAIPAPGLRSRNYFNRYSDDALDLCDVLASFGAAAKPKLDDLSKVLGLPGKPDDIHGADVERFVNEGRIREVAAYCETDVVNTYRVWLRYELFQGKMSPEQFEWSEANLAAWLSRRQSKLH